jgi:small subunit ribosomal protein S20
MPHTSSAKTRMRQYEKNRRYNRGYKKDIKETLKAFATAAQSGTPEQIEAEFKKAVKTLDKAAARNVIHANKAARKKSQLALVVKNKKAAPAAK